MKRVRKTGCSPSASRSCSSDLLAVQWPFSMFLMSAAADNPVFMGNRIWDFASRPGSWMHEFWFRDTDRITPATILGCIALGFVSARLGLFRGAWMRGIKR